MNRALFGSSSSNCAPKPTRRSKYRSPVRAALISAPWRRTSVRASAVAHICRACGARHVAVSRSIERGPSDALEKQCGNASAPLVPLAEALVHLRAVQWPSRLLSRLRLGQQEILGQIDPAQPGERLVRVLSSRGDLAALVEWTEDFSGGRWRLQRVFQE